MKWKKINSRLNIELQRIACRLVCSKPISLPREEIQYNAFVLRPMADIVPEHIHPISTKSYAQMWQAFDKSQQQLWPVPFSWSVDSA